MTLSDPAVFYVIDNNELLLFCAGFTIVGCIMTLIGLRLSAYPAVRNKVIDMYEKIKGTGGS